MIEVFSTQDGRGCSKFKYKEVRTLEKEYDDYIQSSCQVMKEDGIKISELTTCLKDCIYALESGTNEDQELLVGAVKYYLETIK